MTLPSRKDWTVGFFDDVDLPDHVEDEWLIDTAKEGYADVLAMFIQAGGNVNAQDENGMTPLHHAAAAGARACIRVLVKSGKCNYLLKDGMGRYAADIAIEWSRDYAVGRLLTKHQVRQAHARGLPPMIRS